MRPDGSQPSSTLKTKISRMPSQKLGMAMPSTATVPAARSRRSPRWTAATTPSGMPSSMPSRIAQGMSSERVGQAVEERLDSGLAHADRGAEIALDRLADEDRELLEDRPVEAQRLGERRAILRRGILGQHQVDRIAGQPAEEEHDRRHHAEQDDTLHQAARDVALHGARPIVGVGLTSSRASPPGAGCARTRRPARAGRGSPRTGRPSWC